MDRKYDFAGWATRNNLRCSDGRTIMQNAFKNNDGATVPIVWNHNHDDSFSVLGHALLENRAEGVYAYCYMNDTPSGKNASKLVQHGDVSALSIYANKLKQDDNRNVLHGDIREISLVLAGANPGAVIDSYITHGEESDEDAVIYTGEDIALFHSDDASTDSLTPKAKTEETTKNKDDDMADTETDNDKTVDDVINTMNKEQKDVLYYCVGMAKQDNDNDDEDPEEDPDMKHNVFDGDVANEKDTLSHAEMETIFKDAQHSTLKESFMAHAEDYGITNIEYLFPEARTLQSQPEYVSRRMDWVQGVLSGVHHSAFSRIRSVFADITADEARAKGYIKGNLKKEEVFSLLRRITEPQTIYKKQKLDRDDIIDIVDLDVVAMIKSEMRVMLDEEIGRAILIGDGRLASDYDKIKEDKVRPIATDDDFYTIKSLVNIVGGDTDDQKAAKIVRAAVKSRTDYRGSGNPTFFTTEAVLADLLLQEDKMGRRLYDNVNTLATSMLVSDIVTVPVMNGFTRTVGADTRNLIGLIVNLADYNVGADKGGEINMFDDFDIDYNQQKYLMETRCSGALTKPYSAIALESAVVITEP